MDNIKQNSAKQKIYTSAKEVFYNRGYDDATFKEISLKADVPLSLITYYFKKKILLVADIYKDFYTSAQNKVDEYKDEYNINTYLFRQILTSYIFYDIIFSDENNTRLYMKLREKNVTNLKLIGDVTTTIYNGYANDFNLQLTQQQIDIISAMDSAARGGFFNYMFEHNLNFSISEIVTTVESTIPKLMGIDNKIIDNYFFKAQSIIREIDYSKLKFLV